MNRFSRLVAGTALLAATVALLCASAFISFPRLLAWLSSVTPAPANDNDDGFRSPMVRAGINVDSLIPPRLRDFVRGIYIEGYFTARRADGTEDSTRQSHDNGFLIELQFPRNIVGRSDYAPPTNWSLDITWEP